MKTTPFDLDQLGRPKSSAKKAALGKAVPTPPKATKHGREVLRLLDELKKFEWDFEAMKRA